MAHEQLGQLEEVKFGQVAPSVAGVGKVVAQKLCGCQPILKLRDKEKTTKEEPWRQGRQGGLADQFITGAGRKNSGIFAGCRVEVWIKEKSVSCHICGSCDLTSVDLE